MAFLSTRLNIFGLDEQELQIIAAMVIRQPVLFVGMHGTAKTELCSRLAAALYGADAEDAFWPYEVKNLDLTEAIGYLNPKGVADGKIEYVYGPSSMVTKKVVLLDELLAANPFIQNKLLELVRTTKVMGMPTQIRYVFAATNPPAAANFGMYDVAPASLPLIDRFMVVNIPTIQINKDPAQRRTLLAVLRNSELNLTGKPLVRILKAARAKMEEFSEKDVAQVEEKVADLFAKLTSPDEGSHVAAGARARREDLPPLTTFSIRKAKVLKKYLLAVEALRRVAPEIHYSLSSVVDGVVGMVPEMTSLCRQRIAEHMKLKKEINDIVAKIKLDDPLVAFKGDFIKLVKSKVADDLAWADHVIQAAKAVTDVNMLAKGVRLADARGAEGAIVAKALRVQIAKQVLRDKDDFSITAVTNAVDALVNKGSAGQDN